jgi:hypothetical protein
MFQHRAADFDTRLAAIVDHLRAIEKELGGIGRIAGRRASASATAAGNQIADAIGPILQDIGDRFRRGQRAALDEAGNLGSEAVRYGARAGNDALAQIVHQAKSRPLFTLAIAVGVGVLIGLATTRSDHARKR